MTRQTQISESTRQWIASLSRDTRRWLEGKTDAELIRLRKFPNSLTHVAVIMGVTLGAGIFIGAVWF